MERGVLGLHHVTAITSDPQRNIDFYTGVLGLRLVKVTVNFDDPGSYHFYYGDEVGHPGTILTFFAWPGAPRGRQGLGQTSSVTFAVPQAALGYWLHRLQEQHVQYQGPTARFGEKVLTFRDPDGMMVELAAQQNVEQRPAWTQSGVPAEYAIRGIAGVTLWEGGYENTVHLLTETMGFQRIAEEQALYRYALDPAHPENWLDIHCAPGFWEGQVAAGTIHHVAWRTANEETQLSWQNKLEDQQYNVTPVLDREYFHSIYFREPGGVLFEIATDPPGFTINETVETLGTSLQLPPWFEESRAAIEAELPKITYPARQVQNTEPTTQENQ